MAGRPTERILAAPDAPIPGRKRGLAPAIRKLKTQFPEMSGTAIAKRVGCYPNTVYTVLSRFLGKIPEEELRQFQENKADIFDSIQFRLLASVTDKKIAKTPAVQAITGAAILEDKARLVRGQATGINVSVLHQLIEEIRSDDARKPQVIDSVRDAAV